MQPTAQYRCIQHRAVRRVGERMCKQLASNSSTLLSTTLGTGLSRHSGGHQPFTSQEPLRAEHRMQAGP